jgi:hypothetical protein
LWRTTRDFDPSLLCASGQAAYARLLEARYFGTWLMQGAEPCASPESVSVYDLWDDPRGRDAFVALTARASPAGRLYALSALHASDPWAYRRIVGEFHDDDGVVEFYHGCVVIPPLSVHEVVDELITTGSVPDDLRGIWYRTRGPGKAR